MSALYERIHAEMQKAVDASRLAGCSLLVLKNGQEALYCDCGWQDLENRIPMRRDTIFRLYSQTKPVTSAAVMLLMSRGQIDLATPVEEYFPEFADMTVWQPDDTYKKASRKMTVRDLMNMTCGLPYPGDSTAATRMSTQLFDEIDRRLYTPQAMTTAEFARCCGDLPLCFEPGSEFLYGLGADMAGALVEKVSGRRFGDFLAEEFFEPLEMSDTAFWVPADKQSRLCRVYEQTPDHVLVEARTCHLGLRYLRDESPAFESGGAGLCGTLDDYSHFAEMLLNKGTWHGRRILSEQAVRFMTSGGLNDRQKATLHAGWDWISGYTYGNFLRVCEDERQTSVLANKGEYGWDGWLGTFFSNEPETGITFLYGVQTKEEPNSGFLHRRLKNIVMSELG